MAITITHQWQRDAAANGVFSNIANATGTSYSVGLEDVGCRLRCLETATNETGSTTRITNVTPVIQASSVAPDFLPSVARVRDRIAFGGPLDEAEIQSVGVQAYIERQLNPAALTDVTARKYASWPIGFDIMDYPIADDLGPQAIHVARMAGRKDALKASMHEFWANHLVSGYQIRATIRMASLTSFDEACYREALGNFEFLLKRFIMSCPLQYFMDNYLNVYGNVNENLGREVLELFALGIGESDEDPHYDQVIDVAELTRLLTGHGVFTLKTTEAGMLIDNDPRHRRGAVTDYANVVVKNADGTFDHNQNAQTAWFYPTKHDPDPIFFTFFPGVEFSNAVDGPGVEGYLMHPSLTKFCRMMARHRPSARFMCNKIARWFLGCDPTPTVREAMMDKWIEAADSPDQIAQALRVLFYSSDFCTDFSAGKRALTPMTWYSKLLNYFGESYFSKRSVYVAKGYCEKEEYITLTYQTPAGFPDVVDYWLSPGHLTERGYRALNILPSNANNQSDFCVDYTGFCQTRGFTTPRQLINDVAHFWFCDRASASQIATLVAIFGSGVDSAIDWNTVDNRGKCRELFRTAVLVDLTHFAA